MGPLKSVLQAITNRFATRPVQFDASESAWLGRDIREIRRLIDGNADLLESLADLSDSGQHALRLVIADLFWQVWYHAMAIDLLLREDLRAPMAVVVRTMFEAISTLGYLHQHPKPQDEAIIMLATTYLRDLEYFDHQERVANERRTILSRMPASLVAEARTRLSKRPKTWSGKTVEQMARESGVAGYDPLYRILSAHAHVAIVGEHVRVIVNGERQAHIECGGSLREPERQANANFARRALHDSFKILWAHIMGSRKLEIRSRDPHLWFNESGTANAPQSK